MNFLAAFWSTEIVNFLVRYFSMDGNTVVILIGMVVGLFVYWRKGGNQAATDLIATFKARDELQDKEGKRKDDQIDKLTHEVGRLTGILEESKNRIKTLEQVDISRNPAMVAFMNRMENSAKDHEIFRDSFKDTPRILGEIRTFMESLNVAITKKAA